MKKFLLQGFTLPFAAIVVIAACGESSPTGVDECDPADSDCGPTDPPLEVMQVTPADGATGIDTGTEVTVTFNRSVAASSVTATTFSVGSVAGERTVAGTTVKFTPTDPLAEGTDYDIVVDGVTDEANVGLESAFSSSFTTLSRPVMADAGPDFDVSMGDQVTLDKGASTGTGATFTWTQISGPDVGPLSGDSPTFTAPSEVADLSFELEVSDGTTTETDAVRVWVLEDADHAIWVAETGSSSNPGTRAAPFSSIQGAIDAADNAGNGADVYIAAGNYAETLTLRSRVSLYGGFDAADWSRDVEANRPVVSGDAVAVSGRSSNDLTVEGLEIVAADAASASGSSIGVWLEDGTGVRLTRNVVRSGAGGAGTDGTKGADGSRGSNGARGGNAFYCGFPPGGAGGAGGVNFGRGGRGGAGQIGDGSSGTAAEGYPNGGRGGAGGTDGAKSGKRGGNGQTNGSDGANGGAGAAFGAITATGYDPAPATGGDGARGENGWGGGGGGGAHGYVGVPSGCGPGGGGGGGGGEGAAGGTGGTGGGASFGVLLLGVTVAEITDNEILTGSGGAGGSGGSRGLGGGGGFGASGGSGLCAELISSLCTGLGGRGGDGTRGGSGGYGGGGGGGPSIGVLEDAGASATLSGNVFTLGEGGAGGFSFGNGGLTGETADHKKIS